MSWAAATPWAVRVAWAEAIPLVAAIAWSARSHGWREFHASTNPMGCGAPTGGGDSRGCSDPMCHSVGALRSNSQRADEEDRLGGDVDRNQPKLSRPRPRTNLTNSGPMSTDVAQTSTKFDKRFGPGSTRLGQISTNIDPEAATPAPISDELGPPSACFFRSCNLVLAFQSWRICWVCW